MIKIKAIQPKRDPFNPRAIRQAVDDGYREAAEGALKDFESTTATWKHHVEFTLKKQKDGYLVGTDDEIYGFTDAGTKPHVIVAHGKVLRFPSGSRPKTTPGVIGSSSGGAGGATVFVKMVQHPGTKARSFSTLIRKKWQAKLAGIVNAKLREAVR